MRYQSLHHGQHILSRVSKMTVRENQVRIANLEEDVTDLETRVQTLETEFSTMMGKLDILIKMGRVIVGLVTAGLGLDLGTGGMI